jgi:acyl-CoA synthetase (NDP forming)
MFDWAQALAWCPLPTGPKIAVLTNAGGPGVIAADALEANGLQLAELSGTTRDTLISLLPPAASTRNPVDMLAGAGPREYADGLRALLSDQGVDGVIVILPPPPMTTAAEVAGAIIPVIRSASKPVVVALMGEELIAHAARLFRQSHIPDYRFPERAASAMRVLAERSRQLAMPEETPFRPDDLQPENAREALATAKAGVSGFVEATVATGIIRAYGIRTPVEALAGSAEEAAEAAERIGYPVVLKVACPDLPHKSDVGGVLLNLDRRQDVLEGYQFLTEKLRDVAPAAEIQGVLVQPFISDGQDVIVGVVRDAQFGPLVMFGSGGVEVEGLKDVAFALAPLTRHEVEELLAQTWAGRRLHGYRNVPPADREAVVDVLLRIGQMAIDLPQIMEVEINPLRVLSGERGALALDLRLRLDASKA